MRGDNNNETDNKNITAEIAKLRAEKAKIMGYKTHAHFVLEENMLKSPEEVYDLLIQLWKPAAKTLQIAFKHVYLKILHLAIITYV